MISNVKSLGESSEKYGNCEICGGFCFDVYIGTDETGNKVFGHRRCLTGIESKSVIKSVQLTKEVRDFLHDVWFPMALAIVNNADDEKLINILGEGRSKVSNLQKLLSDMETDKG